jgi:signal transduction histidine kinase
MFRTLYSKLALTLFVIVFVLGLLWIKGLWLSTEMYQQEVAQKLNTSLAEHIVNVEPLLQDQQVNQKALKHFFHMAMEINPAIELYLLDKTGRILSYQAPEGKIVRDQIALSDLEKFVAGDVRYPLMGEDPRNENRKKVFSAARIPSEGPLEGYLYIILGSEKYDDIAQMLQESLILKMSLWALLVSLVVALLAGFGVFHLLTKRLHRLTNAMGDFLQEDDNRDGATELAPATTTPAISKGDELDMLKSQFNDMAARIEQQMTRLKVNDQQRREMIANVSHDLRTPLTTLHGYLETLVLRMDKLDRQEQTQYLNIAIGHSQRLSQLVNELFELARLESYEAVIDAEPFSLGDLIQDVAQKFHLRAQQNCIHLEFMDDPSDVWVNGDIAMIQRVLENLMENALRHTPEGGRIALSFLSEGDQVVVKVEDSGHGIAREELGHIFERFYRVEKSRTDENGSTGLGLSIAKRILELHGSHIIVESELNQGTTFTFPMPLYQ